MDIVIHFQRYLIHITSKLLCAIYCIDYNILLHTEILVENLVSLVKIALAIY